MRNYQIVEKGEGHANKDVHLVEIGPRFVLIPIRIFNGSLGGPTLYQNPAFVSPNEERSLMNKKKGDRYVNRVEHTKEKKAYDAAIQPEPDALSNINVFK